DQPFKLVAIMNSLIDGQQSALDAQLVGEPFNESTARQGQRELDNALALLPFIAGSVKIKVTSILIEQCAGGELDLRYKIFAAVVPISRGRIGEAVSTIFFTPAAVAPGRDDGFKILPAISYDESRRLLLGGSAAMIRDVGCSHFLQPAALRISGVASSA